jgi:antitoxin component YwqK of YwqJK toxin-antitoxin module
METKIERIYHPNGQLHSERAYVGGKLHGLMKWWFSNGQLCSEYTYVDGKRHGMSKLWDRYGDIVYFYLYNQGELVAEFNPQNETQRWKLR